MEGKRKCPKHFRVQGVEGTHVAVLSPYRLPGARVEPGFPRNAQSRAKQEQPDLLSGRRGFVVQPPRQPHHRRCLQIDEGTRGPGEQSRPPLSDEKRKTKWEAPVSDVWGIDSPGHQMESWKLGRFPRGQVCQYVNIRKGVHSPLAVFAGEESETDSRRLEEAALCRQSEGNPVSVSNSRWEEGLLCSWPQSVFLVVRLLLERPGMSASSPAHHLPHRGRDTPRKRTEGQRTRLPLIWASVPHHLTQSPSKADGGPMTWAQTLIWRGSRSLANPLVQGPRAVTSASGTERREHKVTRPPEDARAQLLDLPTRGHLRLARPARCGPVSPSVQQGDGAEGPLWSRPAPGIL